MRVGVQWSITVTQYLRSITGNTDKGSCAFLHWLLNYRTMQNHADSHDPPPLLFRAPE